MSDKERMRAFVAYLRNTMKDPTSITEKEKHEAWVRFIAGYKENSRMGWFDRIEDDEAQFLIFSLLVLFIGMGILALGWWLL